MSNRNLDTVINSRLHNPIKHNMVNIFHRKKPTQCRLFINTFFSLWYAAIFFVRMYLPAYKCIFLLHSPPSCGWLMFSRVEPGYNSSMAWLPLILPSIGYSIRTAWSRWKIGCSSQENCFLIQTWGDTVLWLIDGIILILIPRVTLRNNDRAAFAAQSLSRFVNWFAMREIRYYSACSAKLVLGLTTETGEIVTIVKA